MGFEPHPLLRMMAFGPAMSLHGQPFACHDFQAVAGPLGPSSLRCLPVLAGVNACSKLLASPIPLSARPCKACVGVGARAEGV
jgi:hypothetical protein